jgi:hypothetical protein
MMNFRTVAAQSVRKLIYTSVGLILAVSMASVPAAAKGNCSAYSVTIGNRTVSGKQSIMVPAAKVNNQIAHVKGKFTDFFVDMNTFTVTNYTLNGTPVFDSKVPSNPSPLNSPLFLKLNNEQLVLQRSGDGQDQDLKVQAKDCDSGGTFQLESDSAGQQANDLATGINYCLLDSVSGRLFFTNGPLLGYDSPQLTKNASWDTTSSVWTVSAGGRIGMVTGEDAQQALAATGNAAACGR